MKRPWRITVLAGVNGAGKSTLAGSAIRREGAEYWNPDEVSRALRKARPSLTIAEANGIAWERGRGALEEAIRTHRSFTFETTLGGRTIARILEDGIAAGAPVHLWYVGLEGVDLHLKRVRARVRRGGHDIPEATIRARYRTSRENLVRLLPGLARLDLYDNSAPSGTDGTVIPRLLLAMERGKILTMRPLAEQPRWAKPILMRAIDLASGWPHPMRGP